MQHRGLDGRRGSFRPLAMVRADYRFHGGLGVSSAIASAARQSTTPAAPAPATPLPHACDGRADRAGVTAGDPQLVRSAQPAAVDRQPPARGAALARRRNPGARRRCPRTAALGGWKRARDFTSSWAGRCWIPHAGNSADGCEPLARPRVGAAAAAHADVAGLHRPRLLVGQVPSAHKALASIPAERNQHAEAAQRRRRRARERAGRP
jgi:hypothetical protein